MISYWGKLNFIENFGSLANSIYLVANSFYKYSNISSRSIYFKWMNSIKEIYAHQDIAEYGTLMFFQIKNGYQVQ